MPFPGRHAYHRTVQKNPIAIQKMFAEVSLGAPEKAIGFVLWRIVARYQREVDRAITPNKLTHLQFVTLALVAWFGRSGEDVTQVDLARSAGIHPMQVSQTLKALEAKELIVRRRSDTDTRAKCVAVTATGIGSLRRALPKVIEVQDRLFGPGGHPGGALLKQLLRVEQDLGYEGEE